ncbi:hypothetical protein HYDPIDRAFT_112087 [Hydnomerulius pinastri MD-312]|uniref:Uncharacterized protein n=1 Tax=Hydnomerulius pinastri MD-312 TaxID=994086 RepID=A0A0C9WA12_9AGAM|nr:hypothetical protein HYDPIDRAFT_112087 [Hydnomerulius pinastri MD-312]
MRSSIFSHCLHHPHIPTTPAAATVTHALPFQIRFKIDVQGSSFLAVHAHSQLLPPQKKTRSRTSLPCSRQQPYILTALE